MPLASRLTPARRTPKSRVEKQFSLYESDYERRILSGGPSMGYLIDDGLYVDYTLLYTTI